VSIKISRNEEAEGDRSIEGGWSRHDVRGGESLCLHRHE